MNDWFALSRRSQTFLIREYFPWPFWCHSERFHRSWVHLSWLTGRIFRWNGSLPRGASWTRTSLLQRFPVNEGSRGFVWVSVRELSLFCWPLLQDFCREVDSSVGLHHVASFSRKSPIFLTIRIYCAVHVYPGSTATQLSKGRTSHLEVVQCSNRILHVWQVLTPIKNIWSVNKWKIFDQIILSILEHLLIIFHKYMFSMSKIVNNQNRYATTAASSTEQKREKSAEKEIPKFKYSKSNFPKRKS